jgi:hypothetical protein
VEATSPSTTNEPAFVSGDGKLFDVNYVSLDRFLDKASKNGNVDSIIIDPYPDSAKYESLFEYEEAIKEWKDNTELAIVNIHLPVVTGRHYYRPLKPKNNSLRVGILK